MTLHFGWFGVRAVYRKSWDVGVLKGQRNHEPGNDAHKQAYKRNLKQAYK